MQRIFKTRDRRAIVERILALCGAVLIASCATAEVANTPLAPGATNPERRSIVPSDRERPVIVMTFSGGGSRAAALAEAVLSEMSQTRYAAGAHTLTEDVKLISSVSGGSVTAAWFGLNRDARHPDGDLDGLRRDFLTRDNMRALELDAVNPITWLSLVTGRTTRIAAEEALFDARLFHGATLARLNRSGQPLVVLNATDMAGGETFALVPRRFDDICSDYDAPPVATAVAASAAFPILLTPFAVRDFSVDCAGRPRPAEWIRIDLANPYTPYLNLAEYKDARYANDLRHGPDPYRRIDYLYLLDGGLADNLGTRSLRAALIAAHDDAGVLHAINDGKIGRLVVIVVNARSDPPNKLYQEPRPPGVVGQIQAVTSVPIDANTANSQAALAALLGELAQAAAGAGRKAGFGGMRVYGITVDYDQIPADTPAHRALRDAAKEVPTRWTLNAAQLQATEAAGRFLLRRDPCWRALLGDLGAVEPAAASAEPAPAIPCTTRIEIGSARVPAS
jgi:NTE family protein